MGAVMSDAKKNRMSILDGLADSPYPPNVPSNRPMRAARDAVDTHRVWELDPGQIEDTRVADRLNQQDVDDLRTSIETSGQTVPILVRRHPTEDDKYLLVYGRRRLEAIRTSDKVDKVKALITTIDENAAVEAQITENTARRDLSFIEKALFAHELLVSGYGSRAKIGEVLGVTKSWMSMALSIVETVTPEVIRAIGPVQGIGRPRWETFASDIKAKGFSSEGMVDLAEHKHSLLKEHPQPREKDGVTIDPSISVLEALEKYVKPRGQENNAPPKVPDTRFLTIDGATKGLVKRAGKKVQLEIEPGEFADFVEANADFFMQEMHKYWRQHEDKK
jgi:ParB family chromosome partitioning protein